MPQPAQILWTSITRDASSQLTPNHSIETCTSDSLTLLMVKPMAVVWDVLTFLFALPTHHWSDFGGWLAFSRSENPGNSASGLLSMWSGHKLWWDMSCGEDPKIAQIRGRVSRILSLSFLLLWHLLKKVSLVWDSHVWFHELQPPASFCLQTFS